MVAGRDPPPSRNMLGRLTIGLTLKLFVQLPLNPLQPRFESYSLRLLLAFEEKGGDC